MKKNGKKAFYIDSNNYSEKVDVDNINRDSLVAQIPDKIRYYGSYFWTLEKNAIKPTNLKKLFNISFLDEETIILEAEKQNFIDTLLVDGLITKKFNSLSWQNFVESILPQENQTFQDNFFEFPEPINISDNKQNIETNVSFLNKEFIYNFSSVNYENLISDQLFNTNVLPTVYDIINNKVVDVSTERENLAITLGGLIGDEYTTPLYTSVQNSKLVENYFNKYAEQYLNPEAALPIKFLSEANNTVILDKNIIDISNKLNNNYVPFPFYCSILFSNYSSEKNDFIYKLLSFGDLSEKLLNFLLNQETPNKLNFIYAAENKNPAETPLPIFDLKTWIDVNIPKILPNSDGDLHKPVNINNFSNLINYLKINLKNKKRSYSKFMNTSSPFEILYYKIEKRLFNNNKNNTPINSSIVIPYESNSIKYFDTQIKYGVDYYYTIYAYTLVLGNQYSYSQYYNANNQLEKQSDLAEGKYKIKIKNKTTYNVIEVPMTNFGGAVFEKPYVSPNPDFILNNDKILINLMQESIKKYDNFEVIEDKDFKLFERIRLSQDNPEPETIEIQEISNKKTKKLQIYRTTVYPRSYLDFQNKLYKTLLLDNNSTSFLDKIELNTKYYYLFRYLNDHEIPSNVSKIFQVQLIDEDGFIYLEKKNIDLNSGTVRQINKNMKRYLLIKPSIIQAQPRYSNSVQNINDVDLGPNTEVVWGKNFIVKIKSLKSNRILEFNIKSTISRKNK
jgi:hypothetical protein